MRTPTMRSPAGPPLTPALPWPLILMAWPSSMPAGTVTGTRCFFRTLPAPPQVLQGVWMSFPVPRHLAQGLVVEKENPPAPLWMRTWPMPRQSGQVSAVVPAAQPEPLHSSQTAVRFRSISLVQPKAASSKLRGRLTRRLSPR